MVGESTRRDTIRINQHQPAVTNTAGEPDSDMEEKMGNIYVWENEETITQTIADLQERKGEILGFSDGSVKDHTKFGTYGWHIAQYAHGMEGSIKSIGLSGYGREQTTKLDVDMHDPLL